MQIESILFRHSQRGMDHLREWISPTFCEDAAEALLRLPKGHIFLFTGFYVNGYAETDGILGTFFLTRALERLGYFPIIITDRYCDGFFSPYPVEKMSISHPAKGEYVQEMVQRYAPQGYIAIERCGRTASGDYCNMRGKSIQSYTAPVDEFFLKADSSIVTIGIGDGGNEIGMGNLQEIIKRELDREPSCVTVNYLILATVSNWGAYGLLGYLQKKTGQKGLLPTAKEIRSYLQKIVEIGAVDGVKSEFSLSIDGYSLLQEQRIAKDIDKCS